MSLYSLLFHTILGFMLENGTSVIPLQNENLKEVSIYTIERDIDMHSLSSLKKWMLDILPDLQMIELGYEDLKLIPIHRSNVEGYGEALFYNLRLLGDYPTQVRTSYTLVLSLERREASLFLIDRLYLNRVNQTCIPHPFRMEKIIIKNTPISG
jgi:hypothetical protein